MTNPPLIAILDDEPQIRAILTNALEDAGFRTLAFGRAREFEAALRQCTPDVCLVDLGLPDRDGLTLVHRLAMAQGAAVIIISGRSAVQDKVTGLELGADDYVIKPFEPAEIVARVRAHLRRGRPRPTENRSRASFGDWTADFDTYTLSHADGETVSFSQAEGAVLRLFLENPNRLITRARMQDDLGGTAEESFDRAMDVRISRLRQKLRENPRDPRLIKTIYGAGYIFLADVKWAETD